MRYQALLSSLSLKANTRKVAIGLLLAALLAPCLLLPRAATAAKQRAKRLSDANPTRKDSTSAPGQIKNASNTVSSLTVTSAPEPQATPTPNYGGIIFGHGYFNSVSFYKMNPDGSNRITLTDLDAGQVHHPSVSPQTGTIAFDAVSLNGMVPSMTDPFQGTRIFVMNGDGSGARQLTFAPNPGGDADNTKDFNPRISPDGTKVAFISQRLRGTTFHTCQNVGWGILREPNEVFVVNIDGTGLQQITFPDSEYFDAGDNGCGVGENYQVDWLPDNQHLVIYGARPYQRLSGDTRPGIYSAIVTWTATGRLATLYGDDPKNDPANQNLPNDDPSKHAVGLVSGNLHGQFDVAPDGRILFPAGVDSENGNSLGFWTAGTPLAGFIKTQTLMGQVGFNGSTDGKPHGGDIYTARFSPDGAHFLIFGKSPLANNSMTSTLFIDSGSNPISGLGGFMQFDYGIEWAPGPPIPQPDRIIFVPNPVLNYFPHRTQVTPNLLDAQGNVISKAALWRPTDQCPTCGFRCDNTPDQIPCAGSWGSIGNSLIDFTGTITGADLDARTNLCASNGGIRACAPYINSRGAVLSVNATTPTALTSGTGGPGVFTITRDGDPQAASMTGPLTFSFGLGGTAQRNIDYTLDFSGNSLTIPSGQTSVTVNVRPIGAHGDKTVILNLLPDQTNSYSLSTQITATVTIKDDGLPPAPFSLMSITPNGGGDQGLVSVTVYGRGIQQGATVKLSRDGESDVPGDNPTVLNAGAMTAQFNLIGVPLGLWDVVVTNPDGSSAALPTAFNVEATRDPSLWLHLSGRTTIRASHTATTYTITYGNTGNVDAFGVPLFISGIPSAAEVTPMFELASKPDVLDPTLSPVFDYQGQKMIPLIIPRIPAGSVNYLRFSVRFGSIDADTVIHLRALISGPLLKPVAETASSGKADRTSVRTHHAARHSTASVNSTTRGSFVFVLTPECANSLAQAGITCLTAIVPGLNATQLQTCAAGLVNFFGGLAASLAGGEPNPIDMAQIALGAISTIPSCAEAAAGLTPLGIWLGAIQCGLAIDSAIVGCFQWIEEVDVTLVRSADPNEKVGPRGTSNQHYIPSSQPVLYSIFFENQETATAPAQTVIVTDHLDASRLDLATFSLGLIGFGDKVVTPPAGLQNYDTDVDLRPGKDLIVRIHAALDTATGIATWQFQSIDPATNQPTNDPTAGFLPPDIDGIVGEGSVLFSVLPKPGLAAGTQINNQARITFDLNAPMDTNNFTNTIDDSKPSSSVASVTAPNCGTSFPVQWSGSDSGSGIGTYTIFVSDNGGPFTQWLTNTTNTSATYVGVVGHTYGFYSTARDNAGNIEGVPATADTAVTLNANTPPVIAYTNQNVSLGGSLNINPASGPSDNGTVASITLLNQGTYTGGIDVNNSTGVVSLTNAAPAGIHTITIRATDNCDATTDATLQISVNSCTGSISGNVFFDFNANGVNNGEPPLSGWKVVLSGATSLTTYTNASGYYSFADLTAGTYTVTATPPTGTWTSTTQTSRTFTVDCANQSNTFVADFGDYCKVPSGGLGIGFWTSKNGQALITIADLCALNALHLRNANGSDFDPVVGCPTPTNQQLKAGIANLTNWLNAATSTNMSNMLSAQLAAMVLNVRHGYVTADSFDLCHGTTINQLILDADASLAANGNTTASRPGRTTQETLKNCLNALNNGGSVVPPGPCQFAFLSTLIPERVETSEFRDLIMQRDITWLQ